MRGIGINNKCRWPGGGEGGEGIPRRVRGPTPIFPAWGTQRRKLHTHPLRPRQPRNWNQRRCGAPNHAIAGGLWNGGSNRTRTATDGRTQRRGGWISMPWTHPRSQIAQKIGCRGAPPHRPATPPFPRPLPPAPALPSPFRRPRGSVPASQRQYARGQGDIGICNTEMFPSL